MNEIAIKEPSLSKTTAILAPASMTSASVPVAESEDAAMSLEEVIQNRRSDQKLDKETESGVVDVPELKAQVAKLVPDPDVVSQHVFRLGYVEPVKSFASRRPFSEILA